jgi:hypothetical protein
MVSMPMWVQEESMKIILTILLVEALTELFFKAAPLQGIRKWLVAKTPFLNSEEQGHLFDCKYCTAFWISAGVVLIAIFLDYYVTRLLAYIIIVHRLSNFVHIIYSTIRDWQLNLRLSR